MSNEDREVESPNDARPEEQQVPVVAVEKFYELFDIFRNLKKLQTRFNELSVEIRSVVWKLLEKPLEGPIAVWAHHPTLTPSEHFLTLMDLGLSPMEIARLEDSNVLSKNAILKTPLLLQKKPHPCLGSIRTTILPFYLF